MWRLVMRPLLLRPPLLWILSSSDFSGVVLVTSSKSDPVTKRRPGDVGLYFLIPMRLRPLEQLDRVAGPQLDDGLLPAGPAAAGESAALRLAAHADGADVRDRDVEEVLDGLADLGLMRRVEDPERVLVVRLDELEALLGDDRADDHPPDVVAE